MWAGAGRSGQTPIVSHGLYTACQDQVAELSEYGV